MTRDASLNTTQFVHKSDCRYAGQVIRMAQRDGLRILMICHEYPPIGGGAAAVCAALAGEYLQAGCTVTVVTMAFGDLPLRETVGGVEVIRVPCERQRREMASVVEALRWSSRARRLVRQLQTRAPFDVAHAHFIMPAGIVAANLKRHARVPFVITAHGSDVPGYNRERLKLAHIAARPWWRHLCRAADGFISPSHSLLDSIQSYIKLPQVIVIPNGFWPDRFLPAEKEQRILLCSRLVERKGFHHFLNAISDLDLEGWQVDLVGDGPMFATLSRLAAKSRTPVTMHGWLNNDDPRLAALYAKARIFVFPSEHENCAIALLEGMGAGCAMICSNIPAVTDVVADDGILVPPNDPAALQKAVVRLTSDPAECRRLGERGRSRALERFSWSAVGAQNLQFLSQQLGQIQSMEHLCACA